MALHVQPAEDAEGFAVRVRAAAEKSYRLSFHQLTASRSMRLMWFIATLAAGVSCLALVKYLWGGPIDKLMYASIPFVAANLSAGTMMGLHRRIQHLAAPASLEEVHHIREMCGRLPGLKLIMLDGNPDAQHSLTVAHVSAAQAFDKTWTSMMLNAPDAGVRDEISGIKESPVLGDEGSDPPMSAALQLRLQQLRSLAKDLLALGEMLPSGHPEILRVRLVVEEDLPQTLSQYSKLSAYPGARLNDGPTAEEGLAKAFEHLYQALVQTTHIIQADATHGLSSQLLVIEQRYGLSSAPFRIR